MKKKEMSLHLREFAPSFSSGILAACSGGSGITSQAIKIPHMSTRLEPENLNYITSGKAATHDHWKLD